MDKKKLSGMVTIKKLSDFSKGTLLEISDIEESEGVDKDGKPYRYGVATYATTLSDKSRDYGRVKLNDRVLRTAWLSAPCICLYQGTKASKENAGFTFYDVSALKVASGEANLQAVADSFRRMPKAAMIAALTTQSLEGFEEDTVFFVTDPKRRQLKKESQEVLTAKYETVIDGDEVEGVLILPNRLEERLKREGCGVVVYKGCKKTEKGHKYYDVVFLAQTPTLIQCRFDEFHESCLSNNDDEFFYDLCATLL
jgi:hypothetical protein